jgi:putative ABC transport system permease protein
MISLKKINKTYYGNSPIQALKDVSLELDSTGFVVIMGESGSGKTTLLNAISGLDKIDDGEVIINGENLKNFSESKFNEYRNKNLGFIFQGENLIPHLTVIENIMLPLTISGISKKEQRRKAYEALKIAELRDYHINKKPNELSGGEVQRVQIARAIVNNPKIILADEPTSALDKSTREQVISLLHKLSRSCLVLMVTHTHEIIAAYVDRIVTLSEGKVFSDEHIVQKNLKTQNENVEITKKPEKKHKTMPLLSASKLAFKNMISKKGRTIFMSFSSSIGIAALVIVLAVSLGFSNRVVEARNENLKSSPIVVSTDAFDKNFEKKDENAYLQNAKLTKNINIVSKQFVEETVDKLDQEKYNFLIKSSHMNMHLVTQKKAEINNIINFQHLPETSIVEKYYDIINAEAGGRFPEETEYNEIMLVLDENNSVSTELLGIFGISTLSPEISLESLVERINQNPIRVIQNNDYYSETYSSALDLTIFTPKIESVLINNYNANPTALKVTGILRLKPESKIKFLEPGFVYTQALYDYIQAIESQSKIVEEQVRMFNELDLDMNAITGKASLKTVIDKITHLKKLGYIGSEEHSELGNVYSIKIYVNSLEDKQYIFEQIKNYNDKITDINYKIQYDDTANEGAKTIGNIEQTIVKVLVIFAISALVISSILIMSIMFSAIKERIKEIGILRTMGARRQDIMRIFMTEVFAVGLFSGIIGIVLGSIINLTINSAFQGVIEGFSQIAEMQTWHLIGSCGISVVLAMFAGFIPSLIASLKPPIEALRK